jgi:prolipoprotein diacylglyceryltransferase
MEDSTVLGRYLILAASARFLIEFVRVNPRVALGMTIAQWGTLCLIAGGAWLLAQSVRSGSVVVSAK